MDRFYTSIEIADWLLKQKKVTMLGTFQSNRVGQSKEILDAKDRENLSYEVFWDAANGVMNLHSYLCVTKSKGPKNVVLLSTNEPLLGTTKGDKDKRPAAVVLFNFTKGGTDIGKPSLCFEYSFL